MSGVKRSRLVQSLSVLVLVGMTVFAAPPVRAADPAEEFRRAYKAYERELEGRHYADAIPYAEGALAAAQKSGRFRRDLVQTLTANLGKTYFLVGRWADADRTFTKYLASQPNPGQSLDEYLTVLLQAGTAKHELGRARDAMPLFRRALEHLSRRDKERRPARADTLYQLTLVLLELKQADRALETGEEAYELYDDLYGRKDVRTLEACLTLARTEVHLLKNGRADKHLRRIADSLHKNPALRDWQKAGLHGRIASLYERMDNLSRAEAHRNMANAFLRGVGDVELEARSVVPPNYPRKAENARIEGIVVVEFTVRKDGDPDDIRIVRSSPPGIFDKEVLDAVRKWRFRPPRQDGERVNYPGVRKTIEFRAPD